jgi:hypothetical protein
MGQSGALLESLYLLERALADHARRGDPPDQGLISFSGQPSRGLARLHSRARPQDFQTARFGR